MTTADAARKYRLDGKVALITGGGTGIGLAIATEFAALGARVVITGRREDLLAEACAAIGENAHYRAGDLNARETLPAVVREIEASIGPIDVLVNNAGRNLKKPAVELSDAEFQEIIDLNLTSVFSLTRACLPGMIARERGSIINISSMSALYGLTGVAAYSASKTGLLGLTRTLASEVSPHNVRVNAIAPGFIDTPMLRKAVDGDPPRKARILARTPMQRLGDPAEVAAAAVFLASDAASFVTGVCLPVDGGNSIGF